MIIVLHVSVSPTPKESVDSLGTMLSRSDLHGVARSLVVKPPWRLDIADSSKPRVVLTYSLRRRLVDSQAQV